MSLHGHLISWRVSFILYNLLLPAGIYRLSNLYTRVQRLKKYWRLFKDNNDYI